MFESRPFAGLVGFVTIIALLGGLAFLGISKTDLINYNTSAAEARAMDQKTTQEARKAEIDLQAYERSMALQTEAQKMKIAQEQSFEQRKNDLALQQMAADQQRELELRRSLDEMRITSETAVRLGTVIVAGLVVLMTCGMMVYLIIRFARSRIPEPRKASAPKDETMITLMVKQARELERINRTLALVKVENRGVEDPDYTKLFQGKRVDA